VVVRTPLVRFARSDEEAPIYVKPESLQPTGSFKLRGAYNWAAHLSDSERRRGLSTVSAGNTALAVGYTAQLFGVPARSLLPESAPATKIEAIRALGMQADLVPMEDLMGYLFEARWQQESHCFLHPWVEPRMLAGSATIGQEIVEDLPDVDSIFVPVGGGGLIGGIGSALKRLRPSTKVIAVQTEACAPLRASLDAGAPRWVTAQPTVCDGTAVPFVVDEMYGLLSQVIADVVVVSEAQVKDAVRSLAQSARLIAEGSGALAFAGACSIPAKERGTSVCILSGASIDSQRLIDILGTP
jgi:threonine dehydratase